MSTHATTADGQVSEYWRERRDLLFWASCIALIITAMSFAIRGDIMGSLGDKFKLTNEQLGVISGTAFWGFAVSTLIGGYLVDVVGMGRLLAIAFIGHIVAIVTIVLGNESNAYVMLFAGNLAFGLANGFVEAACNPLIATLYPDKKIEKLNLFHVWFPGGIVIGGLLCFGIDQMKLGGENAWQIKMLTMIVPLLIYGFMFFGKKFPKTERTASGVTTGQMLRSCLTPLFLVFLVCMSMSAATELVTGQWMPNIVTLTTGASGILFLCWLNGLMAVGRMFAGPIVHRMSPVLMLIVSAAFSAIGLFLLVQAKDGTMAGVATTIFAIGVCFFWPTMLGVVSERFPKTGALGMSIIGAVGMVSTATWLPHVGKFYDAGTKAALPAGYTIESIKAAAVGNETIKQQLAQAQATGGRAGLSVILWLPVILLVVFVLIYLYDKSKGGYKKEVLQQEQN